jgi:hypothetical protein
MSSTAQNLRLRHLLAGALAFAFALVGVRPAGAQPGAPPDPEWQCRKSVHFAWGKYLGCQNRVLGKRWANRYLDASFDDALAKCRVKYTDSWSRILRAAYYTTSSCYGARFVDNGDGTVSDRLTRLQWEMKTDDGTVHDVDNRYTLGAEPDFAKATGTVFTEFLRELNTGSCFAGNCDWRLPTVEELQTIVSEIYCADTSSGAVPCIDQYYFGPSPPALDAQYWSSTLSPSGRWHVWFYPPGATIGATEELDATWSSSPVRAVRAGL